jgi:VWFA-related protein
MRNSPSALLITAVALSVSLAAQDPGPAVPRPLTQPVPPTQQPVMPPVTYDVDVTLVEVDAVVTDAEGRVIRDLRRDEFQVLEDGAPQTIDRVSFVEIPIERGRRRPAGTRTSSADVQTNLQRFDGRLYVLLLDDLHTSTSRTDRVKTAARRFIEENIDPTDVAAVVHLSGSGKAGQGFTSDPLLLMASVDRFAGRQLRSETLNLVDKYNEQMQVRSGAARGVSAPAPEQIRDPDEVLRADDARVAFDSITRIARQVEPVRGRRKSLVWFGEGIAFDVFGTGPTGRRQGSLVLESLRRAVAAAGRANLVIYGVDARGLAGVNQEMMQLTSTQDPTTTMDPSRLGRELARSQDNLRQVSADTGGFAVVNTDEFANAFERVVEESSAYYLLGYYPKKEKTDGAYRSLEVRVSRPGAKVRARRGYTLSKSPKDASGPDVAGVPAALRDVVSGPVPRSGLPMAVQAAAFRATGDKASVLVTVEYAASAFEGRPPSADDDRLQASVVAIDTDGRTQASDHATVDLKVKPETQRAMAVLGFRTHARLALAPGRYQLRVGALVTSTGLNGSVYRDIEVPDFRRDLQMSGVVLTCVVGAYTPTARADEGMRAVLPAPPTTMRDFRNDDQLSLYTQVSVDGTVPSSDIAFTTSVREAAGQVVMKRDETRTAAELTETKGGYTIQVPLKGLAPGEYVLRLEANAASSGVMRQDVAFRVWAPEDSGTATGAGPGNPPASTTGPLEPAVVPVVKGPLSAAREPREVVARSAEEWEALWSLLPMKRAAPVVTFDNTMIVAVFLGERPTAGFQPEVIDQRLEGDTLIVEWRERVPDPGNPPMVTTPFVVVGVPMHRGPVRFEKQQ